jgi:GDP-L-fucose synthase
MSSFWLSKRVVVTGGAGFLGSRMVSLLRSKGADVFVPRSCKCNLIDRAAVQRLFKDSNPQVVIHAAAVVGGIGANRAHPGRFFYENLMMGAQVMEEARIRKVSKFVAIGTICAYPKHAPIPFREEDLWSGYPEETNAPYGLAKKMLLVQAQAYRQEYGFNAICLLPVNLYGPGDNFDPSTSHVIPGLIRGMLEAIRDGKREVELWGTGRATREFLYVDDCAEAVVKAAECYDGDEPVNVGTGIEISVKALAEMIARITGFTGTLHWDPSKPDGQPRRCLDTSRAFDNFGFRSMMSLEKGLVETVRWYRDHIASQRSHFSVPVKTTTGNPSMGIH